MVKGVTSQFVPLVEQGLQISGLEHSARRRRRPHQAERRVIGARDTEVLQDRAALEPC